MVRKHCNVCARRNSEALLFQFCCIGYMYCSIGMQYEGMPFTGYRPYSSMVGVNVSIFIGPIIVEDYY